MGGGRGWGWRNYLDYISVTLAVGGEREMAEEGQPRLCGLNDAEVVRFAHVPVVRPVAHWKKIDTLLIHWRELFGIYGGCCALFVRQELLLFQRQFRKRAHNSTAAAGRPVSIKRTNIQWGCKKF